VLPTICNVRTGTKQTGLFPQDTLKNRNLASFGRLFVIFLEKTKHLTTKPYLLGVVQGGENLKLRQTCTKELVDIGFDGLGYGGWPIQSNGQFNYAVADVIRQHTPDHYFLYGLGIGKPTEITNLVKSGWHIFDCVLPTRDARHRRLYVPTGYYTPDKEKYYRDPRPVDPQCDCLLCTKYSRAYLAHLFRIKDMTAGRLATIHNLRFYSQLMESLHDSIHKS